MPFRAKFDGADLTNTNFSLAIIARASFAGSKLTGSNWIKAYLYRTKLSDTDLSGVTGLTQAQVDAACGNENTVLPAGLTRPDTWPCAD